MAITRIWQCGAETGSDDEFPINTNFTSDMPGAGDAHTGTYIIRQDAQYVGIMGSLMPSTNQARAGFRFFPIGGYSSAIEVFRFRGSSQQDLIEIRHESTVGRLFLYINSTLQDTSTSYISTLEKWIHIGMDAKIDAASGWAKVYVDGIEELSFSGNTGTTQITEAILGNSTDPGSGNRIRYFDDFYIDDTTGEGSAVVCPLLRFPYLTLDGNGNYAQWDGSDLDSTDNYLLIDEVPPSTSDYLQTNVADEFDSHTMTTFSLDTGQTVNAIIPIAYAERGGSTEQIALGTRLSSTDLIGSDQDVATSPSFVWERQTTKPGGGAWAQADMDGFETVIKSRGSY